MILAGVWLLHLGYGVLYAGVYKLANGSAGQAVQCSLRDAFTGTCRVTNSGNANTSLNAAPAPQQSPGSLPATVIA